MNEDSFTLPWDNVPKRRNVAAKSKKRSSILKMGPTESRGPLLNVGNSPSSKKKRASLSRRVSFSNSTMIKEFRIDKDQLTVWNRTYEVEKELSSEKASTSAVTTTHLASADMEMTTCVADTTLLDKSTFFIRDEEMDMTCSASDFDKENVAVFSSTVCHEDDMMLTRVSDQLDISRPLAEAHHRHHTTGSSHNYEPSVPKVSFPRDENEIPRMNKSSLKLNKSLANLGMADNMELTSVYEIPKQVWHTEDEPSHVASRQLVQPDDMELTKPITSAYYRLEMKSDKSNDENERTMEDMELTTTVDKKLPMKRKYQHDVTMELTMVARKTLSGQNSGLPSPSDLDMDSTKLHETKMDLTKVPWGLDRHRGMHNKVDSDLDDSNNQEDDHHEMNASDLQVKNIQFEDLFCKKSTCGPAETTLSGLQSSSHSTMAETKTAKSLCEDWPEKQRSVQLPVVTNITTGLETADQADKSQLPSWITEAKRSLFETESHSQSEDIPPSPDVRQNTSPLIIPSLPSETPLPQQHLEARDQPKRTEHAFLTSRSEQQHSSQSCNVPSVLQAAPSLSLSHELTTIAPDPNSFGTPSASGSKSYFNSEGTSNRLLSNQSSIAAHCDEPKAPFTTKDIDSASSIHESDNERKYQSPPRPKVPLRNDEETKLINSPAPSDSCVVLPREEANEHANELTLPLNSDNQFPLEILSPRPESSKAPASPLKVEPEPPFVLVDTQIKTESVCASEDQQISTLLPECSAYAKDLSVHETVICDGDLKDIGQQPVENPVIMTVFEHLFREQLQSPWFERWYLKNEEETKNEQVVLAFLNKCLLLTITLGHPLPHQQLVSDSQTTLVHHWTVRKMELSMSPKIMSNEAKLALFLLRRGMPIHWFHQRCPNTFSLAATLTELKAKIREAVNFVTDACNIEKSHCLFSVDQNFQILIGFYNGQNLPFSFDIKIDFSKGFTHAKNSVEFISRPSSNRQLSRNKIARIAAHLMPGWKFLSSLVSSIDLLCMKIGMNIQESK